MASSAEEKLWQSLNNNTKQQSQPQQNVDKSIKSIPIEVTNNATTAVSEKPKYYDVFAKDGGVENQYNLLNWDDLSQAPDFVDKQYLQDYSKLIQIKYHIITYNCRKSND